MQMVAVSITGEPRVRKKFLDLLQKAHPCAAVCTVTETDRCVELFLIFPEEVEEDELQLFEFQNGSGLQTGFVVRA